MERTVLAGRVAGIRRSCQASRSDHSSQATAQWPRTFQPVQWWPGPTPKMMDSDCRQLLTSFCDLILLRSLNFIHIQNFLIRGKNFRFSPWSARLWPAMTASCPGMNIFGPQCTDWALNAPAVAGLRVGRIEMTERGCPRFGLGLSLVKVYG